jgi:hypothetical protein
MSLALLRGALNCGYLHLRLSLPPCLPASLPPCLPASLPPCLPASLPPCLPASLPPCLLASLPPCLPASLPLCLPASLYLSLPLSASLPPCLSASLYLSLPLSTSLCLPLPPAASLLPLPPAASLLPLPLAASLCLPSASLCLSITLHCVVRVRYCCQSQHFHDTMHHSLAFLHNCRHHQGESDLKRWPLSLSLSLHRLYAELSTGGPSPESNPNSPLPVNLFTLARNVNADFIITLRSTLSLFLEHH